MDEISGQATKLGCQVLNQPEIGDYQRPFQSVDGLVLWWGLD